jgi:AcrR family transcriptional regulator
VSTSVLASPDAPAHEPSGADIWNAIVQGAITAFRARAFHDVTLEVVAAESGQTVAAVHERFPTLDDLVVATVQVWNAERMAEIVPLAERSGAVEFLGALLRANIEDPSLARLLTAVVNIAATPEHPMAAALQRQWIQFHLLVERSLTRDVALGREPSGLDPSREAEMLIAVYEGLKLQSMMRPALDLLGAWEHAVACLREVWSRCSPAAPVWEL